MSILKVELGSEDIEAARLFLQATIPLIMVELVNRVPAAGLAEDNSHRKIAQAGAMFETWSARVSGRLARNLEHFGVAELCLDQEELHACRILVPYEKASELIASFDEKSLRELLNEENEGSLGFRPFCEDLHHYIWEFLAYEQISKNTSIEDVLEVDLVGEFYSIAIRDAFSPWAMRLASKVDELFSSRGT